MPYHVSRIWYLVSRIGRVFREQPYRQSHDTRYEPPDTLTTAGFTLVETLVGLGVFLVISLMVSEVFVTTQTIGRFHIIDQQIQNDLRSTVESVALEVRGGSIDYDRYTGAGITIPANGKVLRLFLKDEDNSSIELASSAQSSSCTGSSGVSCCANQSSAPCLVKVIIDPSDATQTPRVTVLTTKGTRVVGGFPVFYVSRKVDPVSGARPRPVVSMVLCAAPSSIPSAQTCDPSAESGVFTGLKGAKPIYLQTTLTPRNQPL